MEGVTEILTCTTVMPNGCCRKDEECDDDDDGDRVVVTSDKVIGFAIKTDEQAHSNVARPHKHSRSGADLSTDSLFCSTFSPFLKSPRFPVPFLLSRVDTLLPSSQSCSSTKHLSSIVTGICASILSSANRSWVGRHERGSRNHSNQSSRA